MLTTIMIATTIIVIVVTTLRCAKTPHVRPLKGIHVGNSSPNRLFVGQVSSAERSLCKAMAWVLKLLVCWSAHEPELHIEPLANGIGTLPGSC